MRCCNLLLLHQCQDVGDFLRNLRDGHLNNLENGNWQVYVNMCAYCGCDSILSRGTRVCCDRGRLLVHIYAENVWVRDPDTGDLRSF